jgi:NADH dehydrogenase
MSRYTLARDFRRIDPRLARIILIEAGPRILPAFSEKISAIAVRNLESLGAQVWVNARVTDISENTLRVGGETLQAGTILWAAGVHASPIAASLNVETDRAGRVVVTDQLTLKDDNQVFVLGDMSCCMDTKTNRPLPGTADVAMQQGVYVGKTIIDDLQERARQPFHYQYLGQFAAIGRGRALYEVGRFHLSRHFAWWFWLLLHIYRLTGFRNRIIVLIQWAWSYWTYGRGARLIVSRDWRQFPEKN